MSSLDWLQLCSRKMLIVMPSRWQSMRFAHRGFFGAAVGRVEQEQLAAFEMGGRQAVGDQDDLPVRRVLLRKILPAHLQGVLDVGEVVRDLQFR